MARLPIIFLTLALALAAGAGVHAEEAKEVVVGVLAYRGAEEAESAWKPTLDHLSAAIPGVHFRIAPGSLAFLTGAAAAHRLDFVITNPGHYLELKIDYGAAALATAQEMESFSSSESVGAAIVAPSARLDLQHLADLRGGRLAAVAPDAFGFRAAALELLERGLDPDKNLTMIFVGYPVEGVIDMLRAGRADAGVIRTCLLEKLVADGKVGRDEFRLLGRKTTSVAPCQASTRLYPGWPFVKLAQTPAALAGAVRKALLAMQPGAGDIVWTEPDDYQSVQDLYRALKVGPYAPFTRLGMTDLLWRYAYLVALLGMAALWWIVHVARVAHLIQKRTRELEEAHEQARLKDAKMEHAMRLSLMGEMASSLAHEINQPLAAILGYARGCERRLASGADPEGVRDAIGRIAAQAERAGGIVRRMREFVKKNPARQTPVEPAAVLRDALALFEPSAAARDLRIETEIPQSLPLVRADQVQIEEVILNLLQNALEAVAGQAAPQVRLAARREGGTIEVDVSDNGSGLAPQARDRLFEPFHTTKTDGLGLGLSLSRSIVEAHGGRLSLEKSGPEGTAFRFYLPIIEGGSDA